MRIKLPLVTVVLIGLANTPANSAQNAQITELPPWRLRPGQSRTLPFESLHRFSISGDSARAAPLPEAPQVLLIKALRPGHSEVWIWTQPSNLKHLSILVSDADDITETTTTPTPALQSALETLREVEAFWTGSKAVLSGQIRSEAELLRVRGLADSHPEVVTDQTSLSPELLETGKARIQAWISSQTPPPALQLVEQAGQLTARGAARMPSLKAAWEQKLRSLFAGVRLEITAFQQPEQTLFFRVALLELKKRAFRSLGVNWPSQLAYGLRAQALPSVDLEIQALESQGAARVLSKPELVVRVPGEAELFSGGEIPLQLRSPRGIPHVEWKPYGLSLKLKALELSGEQVRLEISSEVSDLDRANGSPELPALQASRLRTQVDAALGTPLFLSGLFQSRTSATSQGVPFLSRIPLLGRLFGVHADGEEQAELVAVLLPLREPPAPTPAAPPPASAPTQVEPLRDYLPTRMSRERSFDE